jgi:hypothetical protein
MAVVGAVLAARGDGFRGQGCAEGGESLAAFCQLGVGYPAEHGLQRPPGTTAILGGQGQPDEGFGQVGRQVIAALEVGEAEIILGEAIAFFRLGAEGGDLRRLGRGGSRQQQGAGGEQGQKADEAGGFHGE